MFERETGVWKGDQEKTDVVRVLVRPGKERAATIRKALRREVGELLATLSASREFAQKAMEHENLEKRVEALEERIRQQGEKWR